MLFHRDLRIDLDRETVADEIGVGDAARGVALDADDAVADGQLARRHAEALRSTLDESCARARRRTAQFRAALRDGQVGAGQPLVRRGAGVAHHHLDFVEGNVEFVSGDLRQRGARAGAQIHLAAVHRHPAITADGEPGVERFLVYCLDG